MKHDPRRPRQRDPYDTGRARGLIRWHGISTATDDAGTPTGALGPVIGLDMVQIRTIFGRDMVGGDQLRNESTHEIIARWRPGIVAGCQAVVIETGQVYHVTFTTNIGQKNKTLLCWVKERTA